MSDCSLLTPLRRDGTSQRQRTPAALDPNAAPMDSRPTADLLLYASELARLLRYYTEENTPKGDWSAFLEHDVSTIAARVAAYDAGAGQDEFESLQANANAATAAAFPAAFAALVAPVFSLAQKFEDWRRGSIEGLQLRGRLDRIIEGVLADALQDAIRAARRATAVGAPVVLPPAFGSFGSVWGNLNPDADLALFDSGGLAIETERHAAVAVIAHAFERLLEAARRLAADAPAFFADTLTNYPQHRPHVALFLAFLRLFNHARHAINGLGGRHLDFYYRDVLQLVPRGPIADRVHVIFELAKNLPPTRVPEDTWLNAGKDATGVPLVYGTDDEIIVNRASLHADHGLKTVFLDIAPDGQVRKVHAADDADSDLIAPPVNGEKRWPAFGNAALPHARLGFAVASPMFWLAEGTRTITVGFSLSLTSTFLTSLDRETVRRELEHNVVVEATGPKGWIATGATVNIPADGRSVEYVVTVAPSEPAVVALDPAIHADAFDTRSPVLRFLLLNDGLPGSIIGQPIAEFSDDTPSYTLGDLVRFEGRIYQAIQNIDRPGFRPTAHPERWELIEYVSPYQYFQNMRIDRVALAVHVEGMRKVILESDAGRLNPAKPFMPFGPQPQAQSSLLVGSWEIFQKAVKDVTLDVTWAGLPAESFSNYYQEYSSTGNGNTSFTVTPEVLVDGAWRLPHPSTPTVALFGSADTGAPQEHLVKTIPFNQATFPPAPDLAPITRFEPDLKRGFMRLRLGRSFLHERFAVALAEFVAFKTTHPTDTARTPPNPPYTPVVSSLSVAYRAEQTIEYASWTRQDVEDRVEQLFQIGPFGHQEFAPVPPASAIPGVEPAGSPVTAFPVSGDDAAAGTAEGSLYLGIANLRPPQNVSFLFQMAEGSEDPALPAQDVQWAYLTASGWRDFARAEILLDTTNELVASGIVQFAMPKAATDAATVLPSGLHWLRATVLRDSGAIPKAVAVLAQAVRAIFHDHGNDPRHLEMPLPAGTISKLVQREAAIKSVSQPFSSFGGRTAESDAAFRVRVAERLRHKRRAITIFDYERLVLERFPEVYKVRCLCHTGPDSEFAPGSVRVVVVPNLRNRNAVDPLRPRLALARLEDIRRDLEEMASDFADIQVVNPDYEEVRVSTDVRFKTGFDKGFYTGQLEQDIIRFLSPWLYDEGVDLAFGGRVHRSTILNFIDEREYVDFASNFTIDHVIPGATAAETETRVDVEEAQPTRSSAVIVPAGTHHIGDAIVSCNDEPSAPAAPATPATPPPRPLPPGAARYLGNSRDRELHDLLNITPSCQIDEIAIDRRYPFRTIADAQALGYDFCAYCFGREFSRR